jgi:hypothetical protein
MNTSPSHSKGWRRWIPDTLLGRITLVMVLGVLSAQSLGTWLWASQIRASVRQDTLLAAEHMAASASATVRYFRELPSAYRIILIEQLRTMGGTRYFVNVNTSAVPVAPLRHESLAIVLSTEMIHFWVFCMRKAELTCRPTGNSNGLSSN